jgi:FixJ family two-component response regulator
MTPHILATLQECAKDEDSFHKLVDLIDSALRGTLHQTQPLVAIVDDDEAITDHLALILKDSGFRVLVYNSGVSFVEDIEQNHPDIILLDILMPGMEGGDVYHHIHLQDKTSAIPVIFTTGRVSAEEATSLNSDLQNNVQYLAKPFTREHLIGLINRMLMESESEAASQIQSS